MYTGCKDTKMGGPAIYTYAHMPIHTCVCIYVCVYICVYTYPLRHAYLCMHKYTHNKKEVSCFQPPPKKSGTEIINSEKNCLDVESWKSNWLMNEKELIVAKDYQEPIHL